MSGKQNTEYGGSVIGIDHIAIAVKDLQAAVSWYCNCLGGVMKEQRVTVGESTSMLSAVISLGSTTVVLVQGVEQNSQVSKFVEVFGSGVQHVALAVEDLDEAVERITSAGGAIDVPLVAGKGIRQTFLRRDDDNGVRLELIERRGGTFSDDTVEQLFRAFESKGLI